MTGTAPFLYFRLPKPACAFIGMGCAYFSVCAYMNAPFAASWPPPPNTGDSKPSSSSARTQNLSKLFMILLLAELALRKQTKTEHCHCQHYRTRQFLRLASPLFLAL